MTVHRIAKAATSLRIDDWNDARFDDFLKTMENAKTEVEGASSVEEGGVRGRTISLTFIADDGAPLQKTFDAVECSGRSRLLKNSILSCLNEMGGALQPEEKRQVVFEVLKELC